MPSKRARELAASLLLGGSPAVENENNSPVDSLTNNSPATSDLTSMPSWWDGIFEASDIWTSTSVISNPSGVSAVRRNFFDERERNSKNLVALNPLKVKPIVITSSVKKVCREASISPSKQEGIDVSHSLGAQRGHLQLKRRTPALEINVEAGATLQSHGCDSNLDVPSPQLDSGTPGLELNGEDQATLKSRRCDLNVNVPSPKSSGYIVSHSSVSQVDPPPNINQSNAPSRLRIRDAKVALNNGLQHITLSGKLKAARKVKPPCPNACKRCSSPRLSEEERSLIFKTFWGLGNHTSQWKFISMCVKCSVPRKKCTSKGSKGEKHASREYFFKVNGSFKKVCKTMFKNTLAICDSWVDNALSHSHSGSTLQDQRGQRSRNTTSPESVESVQN